MGRPLDRKRVALDGGGIAVALDRPGVHRLAARLLERCERAELPADAATGLLLELAPCRLELALDLFDLTLRDGPEACVLAGARESGLGCSTLGARSARSVHDETVRHDDTQCTTCKHV